MKTKIVLLMLVLCGLFCVSCIVVSADGVPQGMISMRVGDVSGWLVNNTDYVMCNKSNSLNYSFVPDLSSRFVVGYDSSDTNYSTIGNTGGEKTHVLTINELPAHTHTYNGFTAGSSYLAGTAVQIGPLNSGSTGGGLAHENRPPYYVVAFICKVGSATRCNSTNLTVYDNTVDVTGTTESQYDSLFGWYMWLNLTGSGTGGVSSGVNFSMTSPNPANGTCENYNLIQKNSLGLKNCVDINYNNFSLFDDQNFTASMYLSDNYDNDYEAESFTVNHTFLLTDLYLYVSAPATRTLIIEIQGDDGTGKPDGNILGGCNYTSAIVPLDFNTDFKLDVPVQVIIGTKYHIVTYFSIPTSGSWFTGFPEVYWGGNATKSFDGGATWIFVNRYRKFRLYGVDDWNNVVNLTYSSNSSGSWVQYGTQTAASNGSYCVLNPNMTNASTVYWWRVDAESNGTVLGSDTFTFTTGNSGLIVVSGDHRILYLGIGGTLGGILTMVCIPYIFVKRRDRRQDEYE